MTERVLSIMAHPDDAEFLCAGALILLHQKGWQVHITSMTPGDCGSRELPPEEIAHVRRDEARAAAALLGGQYHCVESSDLYVTYDRETIRRTVDVIRRVDPTLVITHSPQDYMPDHEFTSLLARNACFGAPIPNIDTGTKPTARIPHLYYAAPIEGKNIFGETVPLAFAIDISGVIDRKAEMLARHRSQREWLRAQHGMDEYLEAMKRWSAAVGAKIGVPYAEGFRQHLGHAYPQDNLLGDLLGARPCC